MNFFTPYSKNKQLYIAEKTDKDVGFLYYVLHENKNGDGISLEEAFNTYSGSFIFTDKEPQLDSEETPSAFVAKIQEFLKKNSSWRFIIWLTDPENIEWIDISLKGEITSLGNAPALAFQPNQPKSPFKTSYLRIPFTFFSRIQDSGLVLNIAKDTTVELDSNNPELVFSFKNSFNLAIGTSTFTDNTNTTNATLPFTGPSRGCLLFNKYILKGKLSEKLYSGFRFQYTRANPKKPEAPLQQSILLPLVSSTSEGVKAGFSISIDPNDVTNPARTFFRFTGKTLKDNINIEEQTVLDSFFRTIYGTPIKLIPVVSENGNSRPAGLVFSHGVIIIDYLKKYKEKDFHLCPTGDFIMEIENAEEGKIYDLACGLSGTEYISFQSGDRIRFFPGKPAYAANYPFKEASPVGPPVDPDAELLDNTYLTSWATVIRAPGATGNIPYISQPKGASLYGQDEIISKNYKTLYGQDEIISKKYNTLFGHMEPGIVLPGNDLSFPLVPYAGVTPREEGEPFDKEQIADFERQVIAPTRSKAIGDAVVKETGVTYVSSKEDCLSGKSSDKPDYNVTTPTGLIISINPKGKWTTILLGQDSNQNQMCFSNPDKELQQAFQTNQLFLVAANASHIGKQDGSAAVNDPVFANRINIEGWQFEAKVGQNNRYNDYNNIIIIKGKKGALYNPESEQTIQDSLVSNPGKWTQSLSFAAPTIGKEPDITDPDPAQLVILSQWLKNFFREAYENPDKKFFRKFNAIANDPGWTGILILNMNITGIPDGLGGLTGGITELDRFKAHHFGIESNQIKNGNNDIELNGPSSLFGLIYYTDPGFRQPQAGEKAEPVPPPSAEAYSFQLLSLMILFENTKIKDFFSYAQLTLNTLFGMKAVGMGEGGNPYNAIVLKGSYQNNNGHPLYSLGTTRDYSFHFDSNIFNKIRITGAQMSTRDTGKSGQETVIWFGLSGFLDFQEVKSKVDKEDGTSEEINFDILSFGNKTDEDEPRKGLCFSNLGLEMTVKVVEGKTSREILFITDKIRFDMTKSTPRENSLFTHFALDFKGLEQGTKKTNPLDRYLPVTTAAPLSGIEASPWYGLRFRLNMGSLGELAGKAGLNAYLLIAWTPESTGQETRKALVGIELPGAGGNAKFISLQNILKLSMGQIRLMYDNNKKSFLLILTEIAIEFLGLLKIPPNGATMFYLFGNPKSNGKASGLGWYAVYKPKQEEKKAE
ncbi:MAG: hypothetical protein JXJ04_06330 [Spirochaetales bacterium]|nr:hypothetical protein [Spirochaetales bacterium]